MKPHRVGRFAAAAALALGALACDGANEIVAPATYEVRGTVRGPDGQPAQALVIAAKPGRELGRATADAQSGAYSIGGLPGGSVSLVARVAGCSPVSKALTLPVNEPVDFRIEYCGWIQAPGAGPNRRADQR